MNKIKSGIIVLFTLTFNLLYAGNPHIVKQLINNKDWNFVENIGQLGKSDIKYYGHQGGVYLFCKPGKISFVFTKTEKQSVQISEATGLRKEFPFSKESSGFGPAKYWSPESQNISTCKADLVLFGSNPNAQIIAAEQQEYYENYYTSGTPDEGITNAHSFKTITYESIYPYIDMVLNAKSNGIKYEFIVHPGGKVSDIQMQWNGLEDFKMLKNGGIEYKLALGKMKEGKPKSFQNFGIIESSFSQNRNRIAFNVDKYNKNENLIIDPMIEWGTYYGNNENVYGTAGSSSTASDSSGNVYITGNTWSYTNIATNGSFQSYFAGGPMYPFGEGTDAYLAKFSSNGSLLWATYYGGDQADDGVGVTTDGPGNVFLLGNTNSSSGIATSGSYLSTSSGGDFLAKFNSKGQRQWGTYLENSTAGDYFVSICSDNSGNIYLAGSSTTNTFATNGTYQTSITGGLDAVLVKFSNGGNLIWGTYFGGTGNDNANSVSTDLSGNVMIGGTTTSTKDIATSGSYQTSYGGGSNDAFVAVFGKSGNLKWATYFGGPSRDNITNIASNSYGEILLSGITSSNSGIATSGAYQTSYGGDDDVYLAKFNSSGAIKWATYFGGRLYEYGGYMALDIADNIYVAGSTGSDSEIATPTALQKNLIGYSDGFIAKFSTNGNLEWGTYFDGSSEIVAPSALATNKLSGDVYLYGELTTDSFIATSGAYQSYNTRGGYAFLIKFDLHNNDAGVASIQAPKGTICSGNQAVKVNLYNYGIANLNSAKIGWSINNKVQTPFSWTGKLKSDTSVLVTIGNFIFLPGINKIKFWTYLPNGIADSVPSNDTAYVVDTVLPVPFPKSGGNQSLCYGNSITLGENDSTGHTYLWTSSPPNFISHLSKPTFAPTTTTAFYFKETLDSTGCSSTDSALITVNPLPKPYIVPNQYICDGKSITLGTAPVSGNGYYWSSQPLGYTSTLSNPSFTPVNTTTFYLKQTIIATGCIAIHSTQIIVAPSPMANIGNPKSICAGTSVMLGSADVIGDSYSWTSSPPGFTSLRPDPFVNPASNTLYYLTETNTYGCSAEDSVLVIVYPLPVTSWTVNLTKCQIIFSPIVSTYKKYLWDFGDGDTSAQFGPTHDYTAKGKFQISLNITNSEGCSAEHDSIITIDQPCSSGINEEESQITSLSVYPNPFSSHFTVQYYLSKSSRTTIIMFDITGKQVGIISDNFQSSGHYLFDIDGEAYQIHSGVYILKLVTEDGVMSKELVKYN